MSCDIQKNLIHACMNGIFILFWSTYIIYQPCANSGCYFECLYVVYLECCNVPSMGPDIITMAVALPYSKTNLSFDWCYFYRMPQGRLLGPFLISMEFFLPVPSEHGGKSPAEREEPDAEDPEHGAIAGHRLSSQSLDDDVVAVEGDHCHGPDGH